MKRNYIKPEVELIQSRVETLLAAFSMGKKDEDIYDPILIQSKQADFIFDDDAENYF